MSLYAPHILFIDDQIIMRESMIAYLEDSGFKITSASNGKEGIDAFNQQHPDIILTDMNLPLISGLEVIRYVKEVAPQIPVIVLSSLADSHDIIEALRLGIADYLVKPIHDLSMVEKSINKSLEKQRLKEENERIRHTLLEDQEAGRSVQEKILPANPYQAPPLLLEHQVLPMLYLSGDFVDYIKINDRYFCFYMADVSGHGAAAAFVTVLIKMFIREQVAKYRADNDTRILIPHLLVKSLAHELYTAKLGKYCTMLYFVYDLQLEEIHYTVAGHYPNPIVVQEGKARYLAGRGFPVGISDSMSYKTEMMELKPPYSIVLFSDGIFEIMTGDFETKEQRLLEQLQTTDLTLAQINTTFKITTTPDRLDDVSVLIFSRGIS
jgi:serine phosphatase RsbU (regulator of sigma subunit)